VLLGGGCGTGAGRGRIGCGISRISITRTFILLALGFVTSLGVAAFAGWNMSGRDPLRMYTTEITSRSDWRTVRRFEALGAVRNYEARVWSPAVPTPATAQEGRQLFQSAKWRDAEYDRGLENWSVAGPDGSVDMIEWGWPLRCLWGASSSARRGCANIGVRVLRLRSVERAFVEVHEGHPVRADSGRARVRFCVLGRFRGGV
jgi:hypothetical protein